MNLKIDMIPPVDLILQINVSKILWIFGEDVLEHPSSHLVDSAWNSPFFKWEDKRVTQVIGVPRDKRRTQMFRRSSPRTKRREKANSITLFWSPHFYRLDWRHGRPIQEVYLVGNERKATFRDWIFRILFWFVTQEMAIVLREREIKKWKLTEFFLSK